MQIKVGNVLLAAKPGNIIAHGVNCQGVMGSGVVKLIREAFPDVYQAYIDYCIIGRNPEKFLGKIQFVRSKNNVIVANCFTQLNYGRDGKRYVSYDAVDSCMEELATESKQMGLHINFPFIGAGLGGGNPDIIKLIMEDHFPGDNATLWMYQ